MDTKNLLVTGFIIILFAANTIRGYRRGFLKQAAFTVNTILSFLIAPLFLPIFLEILNSLGVRSVIEEVISQYLSAFSFSTAFPGLLALGNSSAGTDTISQMILSQNAAVIAGNIVRVTGYIFAFVVVRIVLGLGFHVVDIFAKLPIIHEFDAAIGAFCGAFMTLILLWLIIMLLTLLEFVPGLGEMIEWLLSIPTVNLIRQINPFQLLLHGIEAIREMA